MADGEGAEADSDYSGDYLGWRGFLTVGDYQFFLYVGGRRNPRHDSTDSDGVTDT